MAVLPRGDPGSPRPSCPGARLGSTQLQRAPRCHAAQSRVLSRLQSPDRPGRHPPPLGGILHRANLGQAGEHLPFSYVFQHPPVISHGNKKPVVKSRPCDPHLHLALSAAFLGRAEIPPHGPHGTACEQRCLPEPCSPSVSAETSRWQPVTPSKQRLLSLTEHLLLPAPLFRALRARHTSRGGKNAAPEL